MAEKKGKIVLRKNMVNQENTWIKLSRYTYALNATVENFDANSVNYQNESSNEFCIFPEGYALIQNILMNKTNIFFLLTTHQLKRVKLVLWKIMIVCIMC
jgi:hypothetical protein